MAIYYFRMAANRLALKLARRFIPRLVWSGAGVVVRKSYFERGAGGGWMPMVPGHLQQGWVSGTVPPRWVLVVKDIADKEHVVAVAAESGKATRWATWSQRTNRWWTSTNRRDP